MQVKPMVVIFFGAIIVTVGGIVAAVGTLLHNKQSSEKTSRIETKGNETNTQVAQANRKLADITVQNEGLETKLEKQANLIDKLRSENTHLNEKLQEKTLDIYNNLTGGDAYCEISISVFDDPIVGEVGVIFVINNHENPLSNVNVRIHDNNRNYPIPPKLSDFTQDIISLPFAGANSIQVTDKKWQLDRVKGVNLNVFFFSNGKPSTQLFRMQFADGKWQTANRFLVDQKVVKTQISPEFPEQDLNKLFN